MDRAWLPFHFHCPQIRILDKALFSLLLCLKLRIPFSHLGFNRSNNNVYKAVNKNLDFLDLKVT